MSLIVGASAGGNVATLSKLLNDGADIDSRDYSGRSALHVSAANGQIEVIDFLISNKADIEAKDEDCWTPLHHAANSGHSEAIRKLVAAGANIEASTHDRTSYDRKANRDFYQSKNMMSSNLLNSAFYVDQSKPLHLAAYRGHEEAVKVLVELGADKESNDIRLHKPLHKASCKGHIGVMKQLLDHGANIESVNENEEKPLHYAAEHNQAKAIKLLIERGANIEAEDDTKRRPIHSAAQLGNIEAFKVLIELGAKHEGLKDILRSNTENVLQYISKFLDDDIKNIENFLGEYDNSFISERVNNIPLLEYVTGLGLLREREHIIDIVQKTRKRRHDISLHRSNNTGMIEREVMEELKCASKSSPELTETLKSAESRFSWGPLKVAGMSMISVMITILGIGTYLLDIYTDANYGYSMYTSAKNNTLLEDDFSQCTNRFDRLMEIAINKCQSTSNCFGDREDIKEGIVILNAFRSADKQGGECFETGDRFGEDSSNWINAAIITIGHLCLPFLVSGVMWVVLMIKNGNIRIRYLPLPPITRAFQSYYDILLYKNEACNKLEKYWSDEKQMFINPYQAERERLLTLSSINASMVNMSIMFESALAATFHESLKLL